MEEEDGGGGSPDAKRRRGFTRRETVEKLKELEGNVTAAVGENIDPTLQNQVPIFLFPDAMVSDLTPFDLSDQDLLVCEDRVERLERVKTALERRFPWAVISPSIHRMLMK